MGKRKGKGKVQIKLNSEHLKELSDEEIGQLFQKKVLPAALKQLRERRTEDCPVCNPWSYAVF